MEFKISDDGTEVTITGANGTFTLEQFRKIFYKIELAKQELQRAATAVKMRDVRIPAGMSWLDIHYPDHVQRVDLDALDMSSQRTCVLAQASGMFYVDAAEHHMLWGQETWDLCFDAYLDTRQATELWRDAYRARMS